ncbi:FxDxF family PEP-CTERM protein [Methylophilus sp.]|uniref:FxDxF family PEP-CTERM protein n=2 Tax=Methylophilus sp. TaxID=29541 RepID=UPI004036AED7
MMKNLLAAALLLASSSAFATTTYFDGYDKPGNGNANTTKISISYTAGSFDLSGEVDPTSWLTWIQDKNSGLYLEGNLISDKGDTYTWSPVISLTDIDPTVWTFNFSNLAAGNYTLQFNLAGGGHYTGSYAISAVTTAVPEPETYGMMLFGLGLMGTIAVRRQKNR